MATKSIGSAVQKGNLVYVYDEKGNQMFAKDGELHGYTSSTLTIKKGNLLYTYDATGAQKYAKQA